MATEEEKAAARARVEEQRRLTAELADAKRIADAQEKQKKK